MSLRPHQLFPHSPQLRKPPWFPSHCWEQETFGSLTLAAEPQSFANEQKGGIENQYATWYGVARFIKLYVLIWRYLVLYYKVGFYVMMFLNRQDSDWGTLTIMTWFSSVNHDHWKSSRPKGCRHAAMAMHGSSPHISTVATANGSRAWRSRRCRVERF